MIIFLGLDEIHRLTWTPEKSYIWSEKQLTKLVKRLAYEKGVESFRVLWQTHHATRNCCWKEQWVA
jgi:hypothetical protein